jgi:hypothetical protein
LEVEVPKGNPTNLGRTRQQIHGIQSCQRFHQRDHEGRRAQCLRCGMQGGDRFRLGQHYARQTPFDPLPQHGRIRVVPVRPRRIDADQGALELRPGEPSQTLRQLLARSGFLLRRNRIFEV